MEEPPLIPAENDSTVAPPFNAYSGNGSVSVSSVLSDSVVYVTRTDSFFECVIIRILSQ